MNYYVKNKTNLRERIKKKEEENFKKGERAYLAGAKKQNVSFQPSLNYINNIYKINFFTFFVLV